MSNHFEELHPTNRERASHPAGNGRHTHTHTHLMLVIANACQGYQYPMRLCNIHCADGKCGTRNTAIQGLGGTEREWHAD